MMDLFAFPATVFIPSATRRKIIELIHDSHQGITKSYQTARKFYYWPGMANDIHNVIGSCHICQVYLPKQSKDDDIRTTALAPMEQIGVDLFQYNGKHFLLAVDRFSGKIFVWPLKSLSSKSIIDKLSSCFDSYGLPRSIRSDGGPQFRSEFRQFCTDNGILHELASPYHPQSNGLVEISIRIVKSIMKKISPMALDKTLAKFNNMCRNDKDSPNSLLFKRQLCNHLPIASGLQPLTEPPSAELNTKSDKLRPLSINQTVWVMDEDGFWTIKATIESKRQNGRSYIIKLSNNQILIRNRKFLRPCYK